MLGVAVAVMSVAMAMVPHVVAASSAAAETEWMRPFLRSPAPCTAANKQKALYIAFDIAPTLDASPATSLAVETTWVSVADVRRYGGNGVFASQPFYTGDGPSGYFGSQVDGDVSQGGLLFSVWDKRAGRGVLPGPGCSGNVDSTSDSSKHGLDAPAWKPNETWCGHLHAFPAPGSTTCRRHCLDCGLHPGWHNTTGTQCSVPMTLVDGDRLRFALEQTVANTTLAFDLDGHSILYPGAMWRLTVSRYDGASGAFAGNTALGEVFFERTHTGVTRVGAFHEHIGCTKCDAFFESERRSGVEVLAPHPRGTSSISFARDTTCECQLFNVTTTNATGRAGPTALFQTGPGTGPPHSEV